MSEAEQIAAKLTEAQRTAVLKIGDPKHPFGGMWRTGLSVEDDLDLKARALVKWAIPAGTQAPMCSLTPLGLQVREILERSNQGDQP